MKRFSAAFLSLILILQAVPRAWAEKPELPSEASVVEIASAADFLSFSEQCSRDVYSAGKTFRLTADLDLSSVEFEGVPYFDGSFLGDGHLILGLKINRAGSRHGLFRRTGENAVIQDLTVTGTVSPGGTQKYIGGLVGVNAGQITNCSFSGTVSGIDAVGGITGRNEATGKIDGCRFSGRLTGEHQVGGIAGENAGLISSCSNGAQINAEVIIPQQESHFDLAMLSENDFVDLSNIGGIAGYNEGVLDHCTNTGDVGYKYTAYNVGGIAGSSSGYLHACENSGIVNGRRDVGGIAGQLIPYLRWEFSNDKLEALSAQLGSLNYLIHQASEHAASNKGALSGELADLNSFTSGALSKLEQILRDYESNDKRIIDSFHVDPETGELRIDPIDLSGINTSDLTTALSNLSAEAVVLSDILHSSFDDLTEDTAKIVKQMANVIGGMYAMLSTVSGGEFIETVDLSAEESYDHDLGALDGCINYGNVVSENNAGGVVGTMGFEVSFDMEDSLDASRLITSDASQFIFSVVRGCKSHSEVQAKNDHAGCIVGEAAVGAVVDCVGTGSASAVSGDYVGGITGASQGTVRGCWTRAVLSGGKYVGGIVGLGSSIADCRSWTHIDEASEYAGSIAGWAEGALSGNLYIDSAPAGVDGVSFSGMSDPITKEELLRLPELPDNFEDLTVSFVVEGEVVKSLSVPFGGSVTDVPEIENRGEQYWKWDEFNREHIYHDIRVEGKYYAPGTTLSSSEDVPRFLVEGVFYEGQSLTVAEYPVEDREMPVLASFTLFVDGFEGMLTVHMLNEEGGRLFLVDRDGKESPASYRQDGKYMVFQMENGQSFILTEAPPIQSPIVWIASAGGAVLLALTLLIVRKKKHASPSAENQA